ncbi:hypothetical protein [Pseudoduganella namucuonensis]|uniref:Uncharacterized protein n=1 Tax=Pseudoduganella namucuonensis TaxID=1035707 RepID=A0A1I7M0W0_9BURK|nr:hypothetical protein [Pseudoduganella namucuonensis]SFV15601.1 hypothetical protein SAMN05216552_10474 [Pseudoduganella namucuonensis]
MEKLKRTTLVCALPDMIISSKSKNSTRSIQSSFVQYISEALTPQLKMVNRKIRFVNPRVVFADMTWRHDECDKLAEGTLILRTHLMPSTEQHQIQNVEISFITQERRIFKIFFKADIHFLKPLSEILPIGFSNRAPSDRYIDVPSDYAFVCDITRYGRVRLPMRMGRARALNLLKIINEIGTIDQPGFIPTWFIHGHHDFIFDEDWHDAMNHYTGRDYSWSNFVAQPIFQLSREAERILLEADKIDLGNKDATAYENWCASAIKTIFGSGFSEIRTEARKPGFNKRDVIGVNQEGSDFCRRILRDYKSRLVVFEIKNKDEMEKDDHTQVVYYSGGHFGEIVFIIYRPDTDGKIKKYQDLINYSYYVKKTLVVILPHSLLLNLLHSLAHTDTPTEIDEKLNTYLTDYILENIRA